MKVKTKAVLLSLILIVGFIATACPKRTTIANIEDNPSKYYNKEVAVAGRVDTSYGISIPIIGESGGIYKISDGTGSIWVVTRRNVPTRGAQMGVKGRIQSGINYNGKNYGLGMIEDDRRFKGK